MRIEDIAEFAAVLDAVSELLSGGRYTPNDLSTRIFFEALSGYGMGQVREAFSAHARSGQFPPKPDDILRILEASDGRPGAEEAWAIALTAADAAETVVWTAEIAQAWAVASSLVVEMRDKVAGRLAFREKYTSLVEEARASRKPVRWEVAVGFDRSRVADAIASAAAAGRCIESPGVVEMVGLPAPGAALLLPAPDTENDSPAKVQALTALRKLADSLVKFDEEDAPVVMTADDLAGYVKAMPPIPAPTARRVG